MRPIVIILFVVAIGIAGLTAVLMNRIIGAQRAPVAASQPVAPPPDAEILVAAVDIKTGTLVKAEDLRYASWPNNAMDARFVRRGSGDDPKAHFVGTIARRPLAAGEPLTANAVFRQDQAGVMAGMLSPGMRAITIPVTATTGVGGFILPRDHVDILLYQNVGSSSGQGNGHPLRNDLVRFAAEVILPDVRVLAVDDKLAKADGGATLNGKTVTLEMTPKDAEVLLTASKMGELSLALRSTQPGEPFAANGYTGDVEVSRALQAVLGTSSTPSSSSPATEPRVVRINRGGVTMSQSFAN